MIKFGCLDRTANTDDVKYTLGYLLRHSNDIPDDWINISKLVKDHSSVNQQCNNNSNKLRNLYRSKKWKRILKTLPLSPIVVKDGKYFDNTHIEVVIQELIGSNILTNMIWKKLDDYKHKTLLEKYIATFRNETTQSVGSTSAIPSTKGYVEAVQNLETNVNYVLRGLPNIGASCFMNSAIQCLYTVFKNNINLLQNIESATVVKLLRIFEILSNQSMNMFYGELTSLCRDFKLALADIKGEYAIRQQLDSHDTFMDILTTAEPIDNPRNFKSWI